MKTLKSIKSLVPLLLGSFLVMPSYADTDRLRFKWGVPSDNSAAIQSDFDIFSSSVNHSKTGNQRIYFDHFYTNGDKNICSYENRYPDSSTMVFAGQAVKMLRWCKKALDKNRYYYNYTPETDRGHSYVVNLFKVATSPIEIQHNNETLLFPVIGFTKVWNSAGGNAI